MAIWPKGQHSLSTTESTRKPFHQRKKSDIERAGQLLCLARSIDSIPGLRKAALKVIQEIIELPVSILLDAKLMRDVPWNSIFTYLCEPYLGKKSSFEYTQEELKRAAFLCRALSMTCNGVMDPIFKKFIRGLQNGTDYATSTGAYLADYRQPAWNTRASQLKALRTGFIHACRVRKALSSNYFDLFLLEVRKAQRVLDYSLQELEIKELALTCAITSRNFSKRSPLHFISVESLDVICDILVHQM
ncbi:11814_t:CDS:1, partial [Acaulospora colombiana]